MECFYYSFYGEQHMVTFMPTEHMHVKHHMTDCYVYANVHVIILPNALR